MNAMKKICQWKYDLLLQSVTIDTFSQFHHSNKGIKTKEHCQWKPECKKVVNNSSKSLGEQWKA